MWEKWAVKLTPFQMYGNLGYTYLKYLNVLCLEHVIYVLINIPTILMFQRKESHVILNVEGLNDCKRVDKKLQKCDQNKEVFNDNVEWGCCGGCL